MDLALPMLEICNNGREMRYKEIIDKLADQSKLTQEERNKQLQSGQTVFANRIYWCVTHMKKANLLGGKRGHVLITPSGEDVLKARPERIDLRFLDRIKEYKDWKANFGKKTDVSKDSDLSTPESRVEDGYNEIRKQVVDELLEKLHQGSSDFFEQAVPKVFRAMGYGVDHNVTKKSNDGGIDSVISEDKLGLDEIYLQAKRWNGTVPREQVQKFAGAILGKKSRKGIFVTSSMFSDGAKNFIKTAPVNVILVDGETLAGFMYDYGVGVKTRHSYAIKDIDSSFFDEDGSP